MKFALTAISETAGEIPEPLSVHEAGMDEGASNFLPRRGNPESPRLDPCRANGLAKDLHRLSRSPLAEEFDLAARALGNHGWNASDSRRRKNISSLVDDRDRILE